MILFLFNVLKSRHVTSIVNTHGLKRNSGQENLEYDRSIFHNRRNIVREMS